MEIELGEIIADVTLKNIKNIHLSVHPPTGRVRISAPERMNLDTIRVFAVSRLDWIKRQRRRFSEQEREPIRDFVSCESHYYLGKRYLLRVTENDAPPLVVLRHREIELIVRPGTTRSQKQTLLEKWYRRQLKEIATNLIEIWQATMHVTVKDFGIKKMRTKWGSCNREVGRVWLNLELAKKPRECIEYVLVHELVHLSERTHNYRFLSYMDEFLPEWRHRRDQLNRLPVSHVEWKY